MTVVENKDNEIVNFSPIIERTLRNVGHEQRLFRFDNGYGASVVRGQYTYGGPDGLFELAVIQWIGEGPDDYQINYETPITGDVLGHLGERDVQAVLTMINALQAVSP